MIKDSSVQVEGQEKVCLDQWVAHYRTYATKGRSASYIPARGNKCIAVRYLYSKAGWNNDKIRRLGDTFHITKYIKSNRFYSACLSRGISYILERVDVEPTGDAFNSIIRLEIHKPGKPFNPMINAGAITIASLLPGTSVQEKLESLYVLIEK